MSETLYESEILKSLEALDDILTKSQIEKERKGNQRPVGPDWKSGDPEEEDQEEDTTKNGTDYKDITKAHDDDEDEKEDESRKERADVDKWEEAEDKEDEMDKSVRSGVEVSDFLNELTKSIAVYCSNLEDHVIKSLNQIHEENGAMSKAIAENLSVLNDVVAQSQGNIAEYAEGPARGPLSMLDMSKSIPGSEEPELSKSVVLDALMKGVEAGTVSPLEVLKVEQFGVHVANHDVVKSLLS
jgi:hypothetical protein